MAENTNTVKVGDVVTYRPGVDASRRTMPLGIAECEVVELGEGPGGDPCARIKHWMFEQDYGGSIWSRVSDLEI